MTTNDDLSNIEIPKIWERMSTETDKSYAAFELYLSLHPPRRYSVVAEMMGKSDSLIRRWGAQHSWVTRSEAFDNAKRGVLPAVIRDAAIDAFQQSIIIESADDYSLMRDAWREKLADVMANGKASDLAALFKARATLDLMARRTARMPSNFTAVEQTKKEEPTRYYLGPDGPVEIEGVVGRDDD